MASGRASDGNASRKTEPAPSSKLEGAERRLQNIIRRTSEQSSIEAELCVLSMDNVFLAEEWSQITLKWNIRGRGLVVCSPPNSPVCIGLVSKHQTAKGWERKYCAFQSILWDDEEIVTAANSRISNLKRDGSERLLFQETHMHLYRSLLLTVPYEQVSERYETSVVVDTHGQLHWSLTPRTKDMSSSFKRATAVIDAESEDVNEVTIDFSDNLFLHAEVTLLNRLGKPLVIDGKTTVPMNLDE